MPKVTQRQKKAARLVEKGSTLKEVMIAAGYSPNTAVAPTKLTKSKGWQELLERKLPDDELLKVTRDGLVANKLVVSPTEPDREYPDHPTRLKAAEQGYKLKGRFVETNITQTNIGQMDIQFIAGDKE